MFDISKKYKGKVIQSAEWKITYKCNYKCEYCYQLKDKRVDCAPDVVEKVLEFFKAQKESYLIKLIGGEVFCSKDFFRICRELTEAGHKICLGTNLAAHISEFEKFIDLFGDSIEFITGSYHRSQVKDLDVFIEKAALIRNKLNQDAGFMITSVLMDSNFNDLKDLEGKLESRGVEFKYQRLKSEGRYTKYGDEIEKYLSDKLIDNTDNLAGWISERTICTAGHSFLNIAINGDVLRCYNQQKMYNGLGNIAKGTFRKIPKPFPCFSKKCTCTVPINRGMISKKKLSLPGYYCFIFKEKFFKGTNK